MTAILCRCPDGEVDIRCRVHGAHPSEYTPPVALGYHDPVLLRLPFTHPPLTMNEARSTVGHWSGEHDAKRTVQAAVANMLRSQRVPTIAGKIRVTLTWYVGDRRRVDPDSLGPMLKACLDGMTPYRPPILKGSRTRAGTARKKAQAAKLGAGIIPDDHAGIVESVTMRIVLSSRDPRIELLIEPLD